MTVWPITIEDVRAAHARIGPFISPSPAYQYPLLDTWVGHGVSCVVKHENFNPTNSFKVRNGLSFMTGLDAPSRARGVVAATRGNHGLGLAFAGRAFGVRVTICVPHGNNPDKNAGMRALGATVIEEGNDYDEAVAVAMRVQHETGATMAHSTNNTQIIAGAGTLSLELLQQHTDLDAMVVSVGGGSQAVGALTVARTVRPSLAVYAVQAEGAAASHDSWHARRVLPTLASAATFADGLATRSAYEMTFPALCEGLAGFITVSDADIADAMRALVGLTHSLVEPAGAASLAGLKKLAPQLAGRRVAVVASGGNADEATLRRVLLREI